MNKNNVMTCYAASFIDKMSFVFSFTFVLFHASNMTAPVSDKNKKKKKRLAQELVSDTEAST